MVCIGPPDPSPEKVEEILSSVLDHLSEKHHITLNIEFKMPNDKILKEERIEALRKALFDIIQLEYWFSW